MISNSMKSSLSFIMPLLRMSLLMAIFEDFFREVKYVVFMHTFLVPFQKFGSFIWFHLVVTIVFLTGYITYVVFVTFLVKVMWKTTLLKLTHTKCLRE